MQRKWITNVLEPSLSGIGPIEMHLTRPAKFKQRGFRAPRDFWASLTAFPPGLSRVKVSDYENAPPRTTSLIELFEDADRALLILGAPGAGKSTLLLQLASDLLKRAQRVPSQPVPVVLSLESWATDRLPMAAWLERELASRYGITPRTAATWVSRDSLVFLLDGLDEVPETHRHACVRAINDYRTDQDPRPAIALCSSTRVLKHSYARPSMNAVEVQPLSRYDIDQVLTRGHLELPGTRLSNAENPVLDRHTIAALNDEVMVELLSSPLMLHVAALTYKGRSAVGLTEPGTVKTTVVPDELTTGIVYECNEPPGIEERRRRLWRAYTDRMFEIRPLSARCGYTSEQAAGWLSELSRILKDLDQTEFRADSLTRAGLLVSDVLLEYAYRQRRGPVSRYYEGFLNAMAERRLLRRDGKSYYFIHPLLRDHLAEHRSWF